MSEKSSYKGTLCSAWERSKISLGASHPFTLKLLARHIRAGKNNSEITAGRITEYYAGLCGVQNWIDSDIFMSLCIVAESLIFIGRANDAYILMLKAAEIEKRLSPDPSPQDKILFRSTYSKILAKLGLHKKEAQISEELSSLCARIYGESDNIVTLTLNQAGLSYYRARDPKSALRCFERELSIYEKIDTQDIQSLMICLKNLIYVNHACGLARQEADALMKMIPLVSKRDGEKGKETIEYREQLSAALLKCCSGSLKSRQGDLEEAHKSIAELLQIKISLNGEKDISTLRSFRDLITLYEIQGRLPEAILFQKNLLRNAEGQNEAPDYFLDNARYHLIEMYQKIGLLQEAITLAEELISDLMETLTFLSLKDGGVTLRDGSNTATLLKTRVLLQKLKQETA